MLTIAGVGSYLSRDDAIGLALVRQLSLNGLPEGTTIRLWEDADALSVAHNLLESPGPALIVDCADMGLGAGAWKLFAVRDGRLQLHSRSVSTHGLGLAEAIAIARQLGFYWPLHVFGVQPFDLSPAPSLTPEMESRLPVLLEALQSSLRTLLSGSRSTDAAETRLAPANATRMIEPKAG